MWKSGTALFPHLVTSLLLGIIRRFFHPPGLSRLPAHFQFQHTAFVNILPVYPAIIQILPIQRSRLYIVSIGAVSGRLDHKFTSGSIYRTQTNLNPVEKRTSQLVSGMYRCSALYIEQPHSSHDIPCSQLSLIFILPVTISMFSAHPLTTTTSS